MTATLLDGRAIAAQVWAETQARAAALQQARGLVPRTFGHRSWMSVDVGADWRRDRNEESTDHARRDNQRSPNPLHDNYPPKATPRAAHDAPGPRSAI